MLLVRLHDPSRVFTMPGVVASGVRARITSVNAVVNAVAAAHPGTLVLDLGELPGLRDRAAWCVDRMHPSAWGHAVMAAGAAAALGSPGLVDPGPAPPAPSTLAHAGWLVRSGSPWLARRFGEVGPAVGAMALRSALGRPGRLGRGWLLRRPFPLPLGT